ASAMASAGRCSHAFPRRGARRCGDYPRSAWQRAIWMAPETSPRALLGKMTPRTLDICTHGCGTAGRRGRPFRLDATAGGRGAGPIRQRRLNFFREGH
ncbi:hypothetical protein, partial [Xanthomonas translucens]